MAEGIHMRSKIGSMCWKTILNGLVSLRNVISPNRKVRFVKMTLKGEAHIWWQSVEEHLHQLCQPPISDWEVMKFKLQEKYGAKHYVQYPQTAYQKTAYLNPQTLATVMRQRPTQKPKFSNAHPHRRHNQYLHKSHKIQPPQNTVKPIPIRPLR